MANQGFLELGAWRISKLRRKPIIEFYPWIHSESILAPPTLSFRVNRDPLALARFYQSLLDVRVVENRAALARYLGVSRARVTQVLRRLKGLPAIMGAKKNEPDRAVFTAPADPEGHTQ